MIRRPLAVRRPTHRIGSLCQAIHAHHQLYRWRHIGSQLGARRLLQAHPWLRFRRRQGLLLFAECRRAGRLDNGIFTVRSPHALSCHSGGASKPHVLERSNFDRRILNWLNVAAPDSLIGHTDEFVILHVFECWTFLGG